MRHAIRTLWLSSFVFSGLIFSAELFAWNTTENTTTSDNPEQTSPENFAEAPVPAKVRRYVDQIFQKYDKDLDEILAPDEWLGMRGYPILIAGSAEEVISKERLTQYVATYGYRRKVRLLFSPLKLESTGPTLLHPSEESTNGSSSASSNTPNSLATTPPQKETLEGGEEKQFHVPTNCLPAGLPSWFLTRDTNGDGQLSLLEFAADGTQTSMNEFAKLDVDGDGILSPRDLVKIVPKKPASSKPATTESPVSPEPVTVPEQGTPTPAITPNEPPPAEAAAESEKPSNRNPNQRSRGRRRR